MLIGGSLRARHGPIVARHGPIVDQSGIAGSLQGCTLALFPSLIPWPYPMALSPGPTPGHIPWPYDCPYPMALAHCPIPWPDPLAI
jgi:hypothetical protein